jgi:colanic acid biosynthesis glycosyl transferase WcaI
MAVAWRMQKQKRTRVLIYGINYAPEPLGVGRYSGELGAYLARHDFNVDALTAVPHYPGWAVRDNYRNAYSVEQIENVRVIRCPIYLNKRMRGVWRLLAPLSFAISSAPIAAWHILTKKPDVVLCVEPTLFSAPTALIAGWMTGARRVLHVQDLEVDAAFAVGHIGGNFLKRCALFLERIVLTSFDQVITISNQMRSGLQRKGVESSRLILIRNWVDFGKIKPLADVTQYRAELGIQPDLFVVLYSGNIGLKQALPVLLEAAKHLVTNASLAFVISGDGPEKSNLMQIYGHLPNVRFLPTQPEDRLCELLNVADVHVLPQLPGTTGLVLPSKLGGMLASGKPCIVMTDPDTEMYDFVSGQAIILPQGDSLSLAATLEALLKREIRFARTVSRLDELDAGNNLEQFKRALGLPVLANE